MMKKNLILAPKIPGRDGTEFITHKNTGRGCRQYTVIGLPKLAHRSTYDIPIQPVPYRVITETPQGVSLEALYAILLHELRAEQLTVSEERKTALDAIKGDLEESLKKYVNLYSLPVGATDAKD